MKSVYSQSFFLSAGESNAEREMSLPLLTSKIIDIATAHANSLGIGNPVMDHLGCGWVLSRIAIEMERYPRVNETYTLSTWVESWNRHFSVRNFRVDGEDGKPIGYATSVWMVLDMATRSNAGLSHLSLSDEMIDGTRCPIDRISKHTAIVPMNFSGELPRGAIRATAPGVNHVFGYCDLDFYRHVNTVRYVSLLMNMFTLEEMDRSFVRRLELSFLREARYGETVRLLRVDDDLHTSFALSDAAGAPEDEERPGEEVLFAIVVREPRNFS
ncbi:MAG: hypothetical protein HDS87_02500 [Bacteroidales bacterium]|nr:hypothetical protein [Bacteroidales bacterium]